MSYTIIPDLPLGGSLAGYPVIASKNLLVLQQDITRKITPLQFLQDSIPQLLSFDDPISKWKDDVLAFPISDTASYVAKNVTLKNLMSYINTHLNVIDEVFFVSALSGVDSLDYAERGRNEQLPFKTIKFAAFQISELIAKDANYDSTNPNYVEDKTSTPLVESTNPQNVSKKVRKQYTIMVRSGDYVEQNPVYLPPNTSLIGDNLRRTTIRPANPYLDLFWVDSANYIWGFTFRDLKFPAAGVAFPISKPIYDLAGSNNGTPVLSQYAYVIDPTTSLPADYVGRNGSGSQAWVRDCYENAYTSLLFDTNLANKSYPAINDAVVPKVRPFIFTSPYIQGCTCYNISDRMPNPRKVGDNTNNPKYPETWEFDDGTPCGPGTPAGGTNGVPPPNNAGCGMRIDGSLVNGYFRSMVLDSFTQINQGGRGIYIINHGYAQLVSIFTVSTSEGIVCEAGGTCSVSTSNSTFGLSGLVARGMSYSSVLSGTFVIPKTNAYPLSSASSANGNTDRVYGYTVGNNLFTINAVKSVPVKYPYDNVDDVGQSQSGYPMYVASQPYATLCFTVGDDKPWITGYDGNSQPIYSGPGYLMEEHVNPTISRTQTSINPIFSAVPMHQVKLFFIEQGTPTPSLSGGTTVGSNVSYDIYKDYKLSYPTQISNPQPNQNLPWDIQLSFNLSLDLTKTATLPAYDVTDNKSLQFNINYLGNPTPIVYKDRFGNNLDNQGLYQNYLNTTSNGTIDFTNAPVKFYARSVIETGSHTFEYMGVGTRMKYAIPAFGGITNNFNECIADGFLDYDQNGVNLGNKPGTVFFTSSNELGNFKVGTDFTIVQSTGTIQGDTFSRAILTLVTPLTIVLE